MSVTFSAITAAGQFVADELSINTSNGNAAHVLEALGFGEDVRAGDLCGTVSAGDFLSRVLMALAVAPVDEGVPMHELAHEGSVRWIEGGRPAGYLQERLVQLHRLAEAAGKLDAEVTWA